MFINHIRIKNKNNYFREINMSDEFDLVNYSLIIDFFYEDKVNPTIS